MRYRLLLPALACAVSLTACGSNDTTPVAKDPGSSPTGTPSDTDTPSDTPTPDIARAPVPVHPEPGSLPDFNEQDYTFTYDVSCFCAGSGTIKVQVEDGDAVSAEFMEQTGRGQDPSGEVPDYRVLSIQDIIDDANEVGDQGELTVRWPDDQDYPNSVYIDSLKQAVDDEIGYSIVSVSVG